jgi:hypothetical protein
MPRLRTWLLASYLTAILGAGCDQGTEVGNPEITMAARFSLDDTDATASIPEMNLKVMGMGWSTGADSGACWNEPNGHMVDFAEDSSPLPIVTVRNGDWDEAEMMLQAPPGDSAFPDTSSFADWSNPRYAKLIKVMGSDTLRFLFEMPADLRIKLMFGKSTIQSWRRDRAIMVHVRFDVGRWAAGLGSDPGFRFRQDGEQARYVVLSPFENAAAYGTMKAGLPMAFMADSALML